VADAAATAVVEAVREHVTTAAGARKIKTVSELVTVYTICVNCNRMHETTLRYHKIQLTKFFAQSKIYLDSSLTNKCGEKNGTDIGCTGSQPAIS
jgi:hypothetical protein